jgi:L-lactate dehydrogenase complex protein LldG
MSEPRDRILERLRRARGGPAPATREGPAAGDGAVAQADASDHPSMLLQSFRQRLEAVRGEVHEVTQSDWPALLLRLARERGVRRLLYGPRAALAAALEGEARRGESPQLLKYADPIEAWKEELFSDVDAAVTGAAGGIADTGSLILFPGAAEPRLMSLVPPIHFAVVSAASLYPTLADAMRAQGWVTRMPTNPLLISGPSKSADIEQTLTYGVHGPKALIVIVTT